MTPPTNLTLTYLGTTTVYITDGTTHLLTDGFFTRPSLRQVLFTRLSPDPQIIAACLQRAGITRLDAVLVSHSHYDHSMDSAEVCRQTGALLVGSDSTLQVGRGAGLPESSLCAITAGFPLVFGNFIASFYPSRHGSPNLVPGTITRPLTPPAHALAYKDGGVYTLLLNHDQANILLQTSAGTIPWALHGIQADLALLAVGGLGRQSKKNRLYYFFDYILQTGVKWLLPVHHDDFTRPVQREFKPLQSWLDDTQRSMKFIKDVASLNKINVLDWQTWQSVDIPQLFAKDRYNPANPQP
jgi:L-ascorbate metabolism protein UlaG (beta-lactamase superfamily)